PAQKWPPAPARIATRAPASASKARNAATRARAVGPSTAFLTSGRSIVTVQTCSSRSRRTVLMVFAPSSRPQDQGDGLVGERLEVDAVRRAWLRAVPGRREIDRAEDHQARQLRLGAEATQAVQFVERRLPDRVVAVLE